MVGDIQIIAAMVGGIWIMYEYVKNTFHLQYISYTPTPPIGIL